MVKEIKRSTFSAAHHQQEPGRDAGLLALVRKEQIQTALFNSILQASNYFQLKKKRFRSWMQFLYRYSL